MHHLTVDQWSRGHGYLHDRDPRAKILALLVFLVLLATTPLLTPLRLSLLQMAIYGALLLGAIAISKLPAGALELRAMAVLPFSLTFGLVTWLAGDPAKALLLVTKSYLSALAVLLVIATTPVPQLLRGLESLGAPRVFVLVVQFLHRYLFVISEQAQHMRLSAACRRGGSKSGRAAAFRAAAGALSVLFARSYGRAQGIHRAMLSRCYQGRFAAGALLRPSAADAVFLAVTTLCVISVRLAFPHR